MNNQPFLLGIIFLLLGTGVLSAQDFHYSQFYNNPLHLSPALTGVFGGDARLSANYKSQWPSVPVDYQTFSVAYDRKFFRKLDKPGIWSAGIAFNYDRAGDSKLTWADIDGNVSYTAYLSETTFLTFGGQLGIVSRSFNEANLRFDNQFNTGRGEYDPSLGSGEVFAGDSKAFLDFAIGINLRLQAKRDNPILHELNSRTRFDIGIALHHLTAPDQSFFDDEKVPIERKLSPYIMVNYQLSKQLDIVGNLTYQTQGPVYEELVAMGGLRYFLQSKPGRQFSVMGGLGLRQNDIQDAWWPTLEIGYNNLNVGLNYDFNVSRFDRATENRGGWELSLRYIFRRIRPLPGYRSCPLI